MVYFLFKKKNPKVKGKKGIPVYLYLLLLQLYFFSMCWFTNWSFLLWTGQLHQCYPLLFHCYIFQNMFLYWFAECLSHSDFVIPHLSCIELIKIAGDVTHGPEGKMGRVCRGTPWPLTSPAHAPAGHQKMQELRKEDVGVQKRGEWIWRADQEWLRQTLCRIFTLVWGLTLSFHLFIAYVI